MINKAPCMRKILAKAALFHQITTVVVKFVLQTGFNFFDMTNLSPKNLGVVAPDSIEFQLTDIPLNYQIAPSLKVLREEQPWI